MSDLHPEAPATSAPPDPSATTSAPASAGGVQSWAWMLFGLLIAGAMLAAVAVVVASGGDDGEEFVVTVPAGTAARIERGETVELMPADLQLSTGDVLVVHNQDSEAAVVGPFSVRAGESLRHTFSSPGRYEGVCALNPSGRVVITVS